MSAVQAALYARVSSQAQAEAGTVASQIAEILDRSSSDGAHIPEGLRFVDDGFSGAALMRPALERLRDKAAAGTIDRLYVHSPDRLARKYAYQVLLVDEFSRANVELVFLNREFGSSPEDALLLQVQGVIAEYERVKIMERCRRGKRHAARCGSVHVFGQAPFGYRYITKNEGGGEARWEVVLEEARIVQRMFQHVGVDRGSINDVCRLLQAAGILTPKGLKSWSHATVRSILRNPAYKGAAAYGRTQKGPVRTPLRPRRGAPAFPRRGKSVYPVDPKQWIYIPVPRIVSDELFDGVQAQIKESRKRMRRRREGARWLLQGLTVCKCCGYAYYGKTTATTSKGNKYTYAYYRCIGNDRYRCEGVRTCDNRMVRKQMLEDAVWKEIETLLSDPHHLQAEFERRATRSRSKESSACKARIHKLRRAIQRMIDSYAEGLIEKSEFEPRIRDQRARLARLEKADLEAQEIEQAQRQMQFVVGRLEAFAEQVDEGLAAMDWKQKRDLVRCLVKQVEIDREGVTVCFRVEPAPFARTPDDRGFVQHRLVRGDDTGRSQPRSQVAFGIVVSPRLSDT